MATIELSVEGLVSIKSEMEVSTILVNLEGVEDVEIDLEDGEVTIEYDDEVLAEDDIIDAIEEMGYSVVY